jgi:DNA-binding PadR family transcriptional regulator
LAEEEIRKTLTKRVVTNFLDLIVIAHFSDKEFSGPDVLAFVRNRYDITLSSGTTYSALYSMERANLIDGLDTRGKRTYKVSEKGKHTLEVAINFELTKTLLSILSEK